MIDRSRLYYRLFLVALIGCLLPSKVLSFGIPILVSAWWLLKAESTVSERRALAILLGLVTLGVFYWSVTGEFIVSNYVLAVVTYSSFLPLLMIDSREISESRLVPMMLAAVVPMLLIQGGLGIAQAIHGATQTGGFGGSNGDYVAGTIHPQFTAERAAANPFYAINMAILLLCSIAVPPRRASALRTGGQVIGSIALVLASVMHVLVFLMVACVLAVLIGWRRAPGHQGGPAGRLLLVIAIISGLTYLVMQTEVDLIGSYAETAMDVEAMKTPRSVFLHRITHELGKDAPSQPWIGLGPGEFSSRASLLATGLYLGPNNSSRVVPLLPVAATSLTSAYCVPLIFAMREATDDSVGSTQQPFFSWLAIYTELGGVGVAGLLILLVRVVVRVRRRMVDREGRQVGIVLIAGTLFFALIGLQETYWEVPQAILIGLLLLKAMYARLMYGLSATERDR